MDNGRKTPITIVTGFLGSGKTTLLANILKHERFKNASVIINEYGQAGLDHRLIRRIEERTILLSGGCLCCNRREDLVNELLSMLNEHQMEKTVLDRVVIETTGLADPAPIMFSILTHPILVHHYYVDMVVACVDCVNGDLHLDNNPESVKQIVTADKIIITKTDLANEETLSKLLKRIFFINPSAQITTAIQGKTSDDILDVPNIFGKTKVLEETNFEQNTTMTHAADIHSMAVQFTEPLDWLAFGIWMSMLLQKHGERMFRIKGIVDVGELGPVVLNGVQHIIHPPKHLSDWRDYEQRNSQIVFIMKEIEPQQIIASLNAFQHILGSEPKIQEINLAMFS